MASRFFGTVASESRRLESFCRNRLRQRDFRNCIEKEEEKRRTLNMKSRIALSVVFVLIAATAFAADAPVAQSDAQKSFTTMKSLTGKMSPDGKTVEFEFKDISGNTDYHMHHSVFTLIDANHHTEDWTFMMKDKPIHAHFDLHRTN